MFDLNRNRLMERNTCIAKILNLKEAVLVNYSLKSYNGPSDKVLRLKYFILL
jgi:hypothetical protein